MTRIALPETPANGGFPEPPATEPVRVVTARHDECGATTSIRLPAALHATAVRRVRCASCGAAFRPELIAELAVDPAALGATAERGEAEASLDRELEQLTAATTAAPAKARARRLPRLDPQSRFWRIASLPIMAAAVIGVLLLLQGGDDEPAAPVAPASSEPAATDGGEQGEGSAGAAENPGDPAQGGEPVGKVAKKAQVVSGSNYTLALPPGWQRVEPPAGATFMAVQKDGGADATLWIDNNPDLDFPTFVTRSAKQLEALGGSASVVERVPGPTPESTTVRLAAEAPPGEPTLEATLRVAGPYRYYLATTVFPDASQRAAEGVDLIVGSFVPEAGGAK